MNADLSVRHSKPPASEGGALEVFSRDPRSSAFIRGPFAVAVLLAVLPGAGAPGAQAPREVPASIARTFQLVRAEYSGERARSLVAEMDGRFRWPGNAAFDDGIDRVAARLRAAGYVPEDSAAASAPLVYRIERRPMRGP